MAEVRDEWRVVCAAYGTPGHHEHAYVKDSEELCLKYAEKLDARTKGERARAIELPFKVQHRKVSDWEDVDGEHVASG